MAALKANGMLKYIVAFVFGVIIFIAVLAFKGNNSAKPNDNESVAVAYDLTEAEQKELGLTAGDTPHDTLKTLLGAVKQTRAEVEAVRKENERLQQENSLLKGTPHSVAQQISDALEQKQAEFDQKIEQLKGEFANGKNIPLTTPDTAATLNSGNVQSATPNYPIGGLGLEGEPIPQTPQTPSGNTQPASLPSQKQGTDMKWIDPSDGVYKDQQGKIVDSASSGAISSYPNPFKTLDESTLGESARSIQSNPSSNSAQKNPSIPFFTLPPNSTLLGSISMTALIGRVPIDGSVTDPFPFKIMIGRDNLIANGIELPDVEGAIVSGTASGDWTLSCVKGKVENMTFVFSDGRIVTPSQENKNNSGKDQGIGWLSNPNGVPCISGTRKTNAPEYLTSQFILSGAGAAAQGLAQGQTTTVVDGNSVVGAVTGNQGKFILGQALGGGLKETTDWFRQRYGQTFDAIYVPPGQPVAVHITQELRIDYNPSGRKVKYQHANSSRHLD